MPTPIPAQLKPTFKEAKELLTEQKNYAEARRVLASIPSAEQYTQFHTVMSRIATLEGDDALAYAHIERALALAPDDILILARLGKMCLAKEEREKALEYAEKALQIGPSTKKDIGILATLFQQLDQPEKSRSLLEIGIDKNPNDPKLHRMMALILIKLKDPASAENELESCLRIAPTNHSAIAMLSEIYLDRGSLNEALKLLKSADNDTCPEKLRGRIILNLSEAFLLLNLLSDAKASLMRIEKTGGARYNYSWGRIQHRESDHDLAEKSLKAAAYALHPNDSDRAAQLISRCAVEPHAGRRCDLLIQELAAELASARWTAGSRSAGKQMAADIDDFDLS